MSTHRFLLYFQKRSATLSFVQYQARVLLSLVLLAGVCFRQELSAQVVLSEFSASNTKTVVDEDGEASDWVEIANLGTSVVNLADWSLTDEAAQPRKWRFPATNIAGGDFLVVFCSGKDRAISGNPLHTNFKLSVGGEYLALFKPDSTVATAFAPAFPPQVNDVSYGSPMVLQTVTPLGPGGLVKVQVPQDDMLGSDWVMPSFDDSGWITGKSAVGFGAAFTDLVQTDVSAVMFGINPTVYLRLPFTIPAVEVDSLKLKMRYKDGFIAYLNGVRVAARNEPVQTAGGLQADSIADWSTSGAQGQNNWYYGYYNRSANTGGIYDPYSHFDNTDPDWGWNGGAWALGPSDPPWDLITQSGWRPNGSNSGQVHWVIRRWICQSSGAITCHVTFAKENITCGSGATLHVLQNGKERFSRTLAFNDSNGVTTNLVLSPVLPGDLIDFALDPKGDNGAMDDQCDNCTLSVVIDQNPSGGPQWNSAATASRSAEMALVPEEIDLTGYISLLSPGTNVLAIQAMNHSVLDTNFLCLAELEASVTGWDLTQKVYFTTPTPGAINGAGSADLGPLVTEVHHTPIVPGDADDLLVLAKVSPTLNPVASVVSNYRVMYGAEQSLTLYDDGMHGDGVAGDSVFGNWIPSTASLRGQMVRYYIRATDTVGHVTRLPSFTDTNRSPQYFGTVVFDPVLTNSRLPVLHWFLQSPSAADTDTGARGSMFFNGEFYDNILANLHGQSTRSFPKHSYDIKFNPGYSFRWSDDAPRVSDLNLLTTWGDKTHMRNMLAHETYRDAGAPSHFAFAVRVQRNGGFYSVANVVENGDDNFLKRLGLDPQGALYKMYNSAESVDLAEKKTRKYEGTADLQALITGMSQTSTTARQTYLFDNLDVPEMIDFLAAKIITADVDCCYKNYYLYRDSDGTREWQAMPWDVDLSFGRVWTCGSPCLAYYDPTIYTNEYITVGYGNKVFTPLYDTPATYQMFLCRLRTLMDQLLQNPNTPVLSDSYHTKMQGLLNKIAPDAALDLTKWGTWSPRETITQAVNRVWNEFFPGRRAYLFRTLSITNGGEIPNPPPANVVVAFGTFEYRPTSGNPLEEWLSLTNANSYAVDLSGWQLDGGVRFKFKAGTVLPARSGLIVSPDVRSFRSRGLSPKGGERRLVVGPYSGNLSAWGETVTLQDAAGRMVSTNTYAGSPSDAQKYLRITEIFYNPDSLAASPATDRQLFEFIELRNIGPVPLSLKGVRLTEGVTFDFGSGGITNLAPGARVLVVRDLAAFAMRFGAGLPVAGQFVGGLSNAGERIRLEDAYGEKILDFAYDNKWYPITDGHGYSLVIVDDSLPWSAWELAGSWRPSGKPGGSPGVSDQPPRAFPSIVINEVLAHTDPPLSDTIELYNPTTTNVDVGGWFLTDDFDVPRKYQIPSPSVIPADGFLCFKESQFNPGPGIPGAFGLNSEGDDCWLFSSDATRELTGYVQGLKFGATANGTSIGRYTNSVGEVDYPTQFGLTLGRTNAGPLVGPIVISEIMYHPSDAQSNTPASFIELTCIAQTNTPLYHPVETSNTWRLQNSVGFAFPPNITLEPYGHLLVVGFDPVADVASLSSFRALYGISTKVPVYGPWHGGLSNSKDTVELARPDAVGTNGTPYILVEKVGYSDQAPWPIAADGGGSSLQRTMLSAYANDPTNWFAGAATAGVTNYPNSLPSVSLMAPAQASVFQAPASILITANPSDTDGQIERVEFLADGQMLGTAISAPWSLSWNTSVAGKHSLKARAVDDRGGVAESAAVTVSVLSVPPIVSMVSPSDGAAFLLGIPISVEATATDADSQVERVELYADQQLFASLSIAPFTSAWTPPGQGVHQFFAVAYDTWGSAATSAVARVVATTGTNVPATLLSTGSTWKYLDDGSDRGSGWTATSFIDTGWKVGEAELGYGDAAKGRPEVTLLGYGPNATNKYITYYFRTELSVSEASHFRDLSVHLLRDDGAIVYLNGTQVFRSNMPDPPSNYLQLALNEVSGTDETNYFDQAVSPVLLLEGKNVVAVEVHQASPTSPDLSFDLSLTGNRTMLAPGILTQPFGTNVPPGGTTALRVQAVGTGPLNYEWHLDGAAVAGGTEAQLTITNAATTQAGNYEVRVWNSVGSVTSDIATLTVSNGIPIAGTDGLLVPQNQMISVSASALLANDSDPDQDPLAIVSAGPQSQAGFPVALSQNQITYQPGTGFAGADAFQYTLADNHGGVAIGTVEVLVYTGSLPGTNQLTIALEEPSLVVRYRGTPGRTCSLQRSEDFLVWQTVHEGQLPAHGILEYREGNSSSQGAYYRAIER